MDQKKYTKGQLAVKRAYSSSDLVVLTITFITFFLLTCGYFVISYFIEATKDVPLTPIVATMGLIGVMIGGAFLFM